MAPAGMVGLLLSYRLDGACSVAGAAGAAPAGAAHRSVSSRSGTRIWGRMLSPFGGYLPTGCLRTSSALALTRAMSSSGVPLVRMSWNWVR